MDTVAHQERFAAAMTAITRRLPFGLSGVVAPSLLGYLLINLGTFFIDLGLLAAFHGGLRWPIPIAVTCSYGTASATSYVLNRVLNFRSRADVSRQFPVFAAVSVSNYLVFVLGVTDLLSAAGVYYEFSRVIAACCESVYLYCMLRWVVFRDSPGALGAGEDDTAIASPIAEGTIVSDARDGGSLSGPPATEITTAADARDGVAPATPRESAGQEPQPMGTGPGHRPAAEPR
jgi:putative flippase GtrA